MVEAVMLWNEPNNMSHWNFSLDPDWSIFAAMVRAASERIRSINPRLPIVLGGVSPIDCDFFRLMQKHGVLDAVDIVAVHGFPLDWNHWNVNEWPQKLAQVKDVVRRPVWVSEVGASSFGADEVQVFGLERMTELLTGRADRIHWYSLFDLPPTWTATTRHKEAEGSSYYRHYHMGLIRADGSPKMAADAFPPTGELGLCQWFHYGDPRLESAVQWMRRLGVRYLRTGLSWADSFRPNAAAWFDHQMQALDEFDVTMTLCFTPEHLGLEAHYASPPRDPATFADFAEFAVRRYASGAPAGNPTTTTLVSDRHEEAMTTL